MVTGGQAKAIQRKCLMMAPGVPRAAAPPHRKLDGSSQLLACKRCTHVKPKKGVSTTSKQRHLHQIPYPHQRLAEEKDEDGVEQNIPSNGVRMPLFRH